MNNIYFVKIEIQIFKKINFVNQVKAIFYFKKEHFVLYFYTQKKKLYLHITKKNFQKLENPKCPLIE